MFEVQHQSFGAGPGLEPGEDEFVERDDGQTRQRDVAACGDGRAQRRRASSRTARIRWALRRYDRPDRNDPASTKRPRSRDRTRSIGFDMRLFPSVSIADGSIIGTLRAEPHPPAIPAERSMR